MEGAGEFVLPTLNFLTYVGIGCIVLGVLLILGILKGNAGVVGNILGGVAVIAVGIFVITLKYPGKITIEPDHLVLKVPLYKAKLIEEAAIRRIWIEDLDNSAWRPVRKTSGSNFGKVRSGWFRLKNGRKAFLVLYGMKAICIEMDGGQLFLLGMKDFDRFEEAVRLNIPQLSPVGVPIK